MLNTTAWKRFNTEKIFLKSWIFPNNWLLNFFQNLTHSFFSEFRTGSSNLQNFDRLKKVHVTLRRLLVKYQIYLHMKKTLMIMISSFVVKFGSSYLDSVQGTLFLNAFTDESFVLNLFSIRTMANCLLTDFHINVFSIKQLFKEPMWRLRIAFTNSWKFSKALMLSLI